LRLPLDHELALPGFGAVVREAQEVEGLFPESFAAAHRIRCSVVSTTVELEAALAAADHGASMIEVPLQRMDAPRSLVQFARRAAGFNFSQLVQR